MNCIFGRVFNGGSIVSENSLCVSFARSTLRVACAAAAAKRARILHTLVSAPRESRSGPSRAKQLCPRCPCGIALHAGGGAAGGGAGAGGSACGAYHALACRRIQATGRHNKFAEAFDYVLRMLPGITKRVDGVGSYAGASSLGTYVKPDGTVAHLCPDRTVYGLADMPLSGRYIVDFALVDASAATYLAAGPANKPLAAAAAKVQSKLAKYNNTGLLRPGDVFKPVVAEIGGLDKDTWTQLWRWAERVAEQGGVSGASHKTAQQIVHGWRVRLSVGLFQARVGHVAQGLLTVAVGGGGAGARAPWRTGPAGGLYAEQRIKMYHF